VSIQGKLAVEPEKMTRHLSTKQETRKGPRPLQQTTVNNNKLKNASSPRYIQSITKERSSFKVYNPTKNREPLSTRLIGGSGVESFELSVSDEADRATAKGLPVGIARFPTHGPLSIQTPAGPAEKRDEQMGLKLDLGDELYLPPGVSVGKKS